MASSAGLLKEQFRNWNLPLPLLLCELQKVVRFNNRVEGVLNFV